MTFHRASLTLCLALILLPALRVAAVTRIHVAPQGNDAHAGTTERPLATPQAARDQTRRIIAQGVAEPVEIVFATGTYRLASSLELRPEDSGAANLRSRGAPHRGPRSSGPVVRPFLKNGARPPTVFGKST